MTIGDRHSADVQPTSADISTTSDVSRLAVSLKAFVGCAHNDNRSRDYLGSEPDLFEYLKTQSQGALAEATDPTVSHVEVLKDALRRALSSLPDSIAEAFSILYALKKPYSHYGSRRRREIAAELLYPGMEWETFRDKHELPYHSDVAEELVRVAATSAKALSTSRISDFAREQIDWKQIVPRYFQITRAAYGLEGALGLLKLEGAGDVESDLSTDARKLTNAFAAWRYTQLRTHIRDFRQAGLPFVSVDPEDEAKINRSVQAIELGSPFTSMENGRLRKLFRETDADFALFNEVLVESHILHPRFGWNERLLQPLRELQESLGFLFSDVGTEDPRVHEWGDDQMKPRFEGFGIIPKKYQEEVAGGIKLSKFEWRKYLNHPDPILQNLARLMVPSEDGS